SALGAASSMRVTATDAGAVRATMLGDVASSSQVTVNASGANSAEGTIDVIAFTFGFAGTGAGALAEITDDADVEAYVGPASSIAYAGAVAVTASGDNEATASSEIGSGGAFNFTVSEPTALVEGDIRAQVEGDVLSGSALTVSATGPFAASATSSPFGLGLLFDGASVQSDAEVSGAAEAIIGPSVD